MAPAYDLCHAYRPGSEWVIQHALSINGKRKEIKKEHLLTIGKSIGCKNASNIIDEINETIQGWHVFADSVKVSPTLRDKIKSTIIDLNL